MVNLTALFPAAGKGSRLGKIPCSKEIMPLGFRSGNQIDPDIKDKLWNPTTTIEAHIQAVKEANATKVGIIVSEAKWDIVKYLGDGSQFDLPIAYFFQNKLQGMPFALDLAYHWIKDSTILFSMPDTLINPINFMKQLVDHHLSQHNDITLGLFRTTTPEKFGMVELDHQQRIVGFIDKPTQSHLELMWGSAVWSPKFTDFMHSYLSTQDAISVECVLSDLFLAFLNEGGQIGHYLFENGNYHDIGTPKSFQNAVYELALEQIDQK